MLIQLQSPWLPELFPLFEDVKKIAPPNAYDIVGYVATSLSLSLLICWRRPAFYVSFWQLSTYDLTPPSIKYDDEVANLRNLSRQEDSLYISADRSSDRSMRLTASSHRARRDRYNAFVHTLAQEFKQQTLLRAFTLKRLAREKQHWFSHCADCLCLLSIDTDELFQRKTRRRSSDL